MADCNLIPKPRAKSGALALDLAIATGATAILLSLFACAPAPQPPAKTSVHVKRSAPILTADAKEWCETFGYRENSHAFNDCIARWARAERFATQQLRGADQADSNGSR
jgi:hypothetical protein